MISAMPASRSACSTYHSIGRPQSSCSTFGRALFMRVPLPAANTIARDHAHRPSSALPLAHLLGAAEQVERVAQALAHRSRPSSSIESKSGIDVGLPVIAT